MCLSGSAQILHAVSASYTKNKYVCNRMSSSPQFLKEHHSFLMQRLCGKEKAKFRVGYLSLPKQQIAVHSFFQPLGFITNIFLIQTNFFKCALGKVKSKHIRQQNDNSLDEELFGHLLDSPEAWSLRQDLVPGVQLPKAYNKNVVVYAAENLL